jgi:hypothetical protein
MLPRNRRLTAGLNRYSEVRKFRKNRALAGGTVLGQLMCGPRASHVADGFATRIVFSAGRGP